MSSMPLVSVCCITYNHEPYIHQCLDGFVTQQTTFPIEILIHDDASTDGTTLIIKEYENKYPELIKPIYQKVNQHSQGINVLQFNFSRAQGKYIAYCEGDDYWIDPLKLQKQVDFLENNPEYGLCYTKARSYFQEKKRFSLKTYGRNHSTTEDIILNWGQIPTLTTISRRELLNQYHKEINPETKHWVFGDRPMWIWFAINSKMHYVNEITGIYRILEVSASHKKTYEEMTKLRDNLYDIRNFFVDLYNLQHLKETIENKKILEYAYLAISFARYDEYRKIIVKAKGTSIKIKIKKIIGKSILLMKLYHILSRII